MKSTTAITDEELKKLLNFAGYGNPDGPVWFLGMEEAGGGEKNIRARLKLEPVEDNLRAHKLLGLTQHHEGKKIIQMTWRGMCIIMLSRDAKETDKDNIREYQASALGRIGRETFLTELFPIPKSNLEAWTKEYETLFPQFKSRCDYYDETLPQRIQLLQDLISTRKPKIIVAYGKKYWGKFKTLFDDRTFEEEGIFLKSSGSPYVILTPHFRSIQMNKGINQLATIVNNVSINNVG